MKLTAIKTRVFVPPQDDLYKLLDEFLPELKEKEVVFVTSKIVAIHQGRCIPVSEVKDKDDLIKQEADYYIPRADSPNNYVVLTIKDHTLIPSAGIDESNANKHYILWPKEINKTATDIKNYLQNKFNIKNLGIIITDSRCTPFRYGVVGVAIGYSGIKPLKNYVGSSDIFGRQLKVSKVNIIDSLAATAVLCMGEGAEQTPLALASELESLVEFTNEDMTEEIFIPKEEDIYYPLLKDFYNDKK